MEGQVMSKKIKKDKHAFDHFQMSSRQLQNKWNFSCCSKCLTEFGFTGECVQLHHGESAHKYYPYPKKPWHLNFPSSHVYFSVKSTLIHKFGNPLRDVGKCPWYPASRKTTCFRRGLLNALQRGCSASKLVKDGVACQKQDVCSILFHSYLPLWVFLVRIILF